MAKRKQIEAKIHPQLASLAMSVEQLVPDPTNARRHDDRNLQAIAQSLDEHGQRKPIVAQRVGDRLIVRAGNGTLAAAQQLGWSSLAVVVVEEGDVEATRYALRDNRTAELAEWDDDALRQALRECAESEADIAALGWTPEDLQTPESDGSGSSEQTIYTKKIEAPLYEPTGPKPEISELFDRQKAEKLQAEIDSANLPAEVASFLRFAAERHTVFNYRQIAEFYAHADERTQLLMEASGLVIIDFDKAIEHGFVKLTERLGALVGSRLEGEEDDDA